MCGIAGSVIWNKPDDERNIALMLAKLAHRGPDAGHTVSIPPAALGHKRLSIIDTRSIADQPLSCSNKRFTITYNGEIYNYQTLRTQLEELGSIFTTNSDTEVILEAWKHWQEGCLQHFVGMFAFAIWDKQDQTLFMARDRMGEKPFYYTHPIVNEPNSGIIFASELTALCEHPLVEKQLNYDAISQFLSLNYILTNCCIAKGVFKLPPAHYMLVKKDTAPVIKEYWNLASFFHNKRSFKNPQDASDELLTLLDESVKGQCISDVPLGAFLSGGLDSSSIVASMKTNQDASLVKTFSIGFAEDSFSELEQSKQVAEHLNVDHHTKTVTSDLFSNLKDIINYTDEPFADNSIIPTYFLAQYTRKNVTVSLSGDGGDEIFAGYETNIADLIQAKTNLIPKPLITFAYKTVNTFFPSSFGKVSFDYKLKHLLYGCQFDYQKAHYSWRKIFSEQEKSELFKEHAATADPFLSYRTFYDDVKDCHLVDQSSYVDIKTWLVDDILVKTDRMTMAHSLESRTPFLDHRIVEFAAQLPVDLKLKGLSKKHILKQSQHARLPDNIINRKKSGFNAPISLWVNANNADYCKKILFSEHMSQIFNIFTIESLLNEHLEKKKDNSFKLFGLICLSIWLDKWHET